MLLFSRRKWLYSATLLKGMKRTILTSRCYLLSPHRYNTITKVQDVRTIQSSLLDEFSQTIIQSKGAQKLSPGFGEVPIHYRQNRACKRCYCKNLKNQNLATQYRLNQIGSTRIGNGMGCRKCLSKQLTLYRAHHSSSQMREIREWERVTMISLQSYTWPFDWPGYVRKGV